MYDFFKKGEGLLSEALANERDLMKEIKKLNN